MPGGGGKEAVAWRCRRAGGGSDDRDPLPGVLPYGGTPGASRSNTTEAGLYIKSPAER